MNNKDERRTKVRDFMHESGNMQELLKNFVPNLIAYPSNDIREIHRLMQLINLEYLPVVLSPWNKKIIGIIKLSDVSGS